jgi:DNA topoisomerase-1
MSATKRTVVPMSPLAGMDIARLKAAASAAKLRHVSDGRPGITRVRASQGFEYRDPDGARITDEDALARIRKLAIPPAYENVWICPIPNGHLQAVGRDARGRKQYRYHPRWRAVRDEGKYGKMLLFGKVLQDPPARGPGSESPRLAARESVGGDRAPAGNHLDASRQ